MTTPAAAKASERLARAGVSLATGANWPTVTVGASVGRQSDTWLPKDNVGAVSASLNYTLFNGGAREAAVQKARAAQRAAEASVRSIANQLMTNLQTAWNALYDARATLQVQDQFVDADTEREKIAKAQYTSGLLNFNEFIIIQDNLVATKQAHLNAQASLMKAQAAWERAEGINL